MLAVLLIHYVSANYRNVDVGDFLSDPRRHVCSGTWAANEHVDYFPSIPS